MARTFPLLALLAFLISGTPALASAQTITVHDLTVDDDAPPEQYRAMLDAAIARAIVPIRACYARELATHPGLRGDLRLRLWVSARQVIRVTPETTIGNPALETCAHDEVHRFTLPPQAPEGGAAVRFVMRFAAPAVTATPTPPPAPPPPPASIAVARPVPEATIERFGVALDRVRGGLASEALALILTRSIFDRCWAAGLTGSVPVTVSITAAGVATARAGRGSMRDASARTCIASVISGTAFPTAARTTRVRVTVAPLP